MKKILFAVSAMVLLVTAGVSAQPAPSGISMEKWLVPVRADFWRQTRAGLTGAVLPVCFLIFAGGA